MKEGRRKKVEYVFSFIHFFGNLDKNLKTVNISSSIGSSGKN